MTTKTVFVVGRRDLSSENWSVMGIFTGEDAARKACVERLDFVGPVPLDERLPDEKTSWPLAYYPNCQK